MECMFVLRLLTGLLALDVVSTDSDVVRTACAAQLRIISPADGTVVTPSFSVVARLVVRPGATLPLPLDATELCFSVDGDGIGCLAESHIQLHRVGRRRHVRRCPRWRRLRQLARSLGAARLGPHARPLPAALLTQGAIRQ